MTELKRIRISTGMKQSQVADIYGIPQRTYQNWELGTRKGPDYVINRIIKDLEDLKIGETYKSVVMIKYANNNIKVIPCQDRSSAEECSLRLYDTLDKDDYIRINAGSMKYNGKYSKEIRESYIDIK